MQPSPAPRRGLNHVRLILLVAAMFTLLVAMMYRTAPIVVMASTLCAVVLCSTPPLGTLIARFWGRGLTAQRQLPESGQVGEIIGGRLLLKNSGKSPALLVHVQPGQAFVTSRRRSAPTAAVALVSPEEHVVPLLRGGDSFQTSPRWLLQKRGVFAMAPVMAGARDPLGLFPGLSPRTPPHEIIVMPRPLRIERLGLAGGARNNPQTSQHANLTAEALDFHGVRPWRAGEPIRRVHWKSTARTGALHIVEWEDSPGSDISIVFDTAPIAPHNGEDEGFESAIVLIASVGAHCLENGYRFQLFCAQNGDDAARARGEYSQMKFSADNASETVPLLQALALLQPLTPLPDATSNSDFGALAARISSLVGRGAAALLIGNTHSDFAGALASLAGSSATSLHALALDGASFQGDTAPQGETTAPNLPDIVRIVRAGDSLSEALERLA